MKSAQVAARVETRSYARSEVEPPRDNFYYAGLKRSGWTSSRLYRRTIKYTNNLNCKLSPACPFKVLLQLKSIQPMMCFLRPRTLHRGSQACWSLVRLSWGEGRVHPGPRTVRLTPDCSFILHLSGSQTWGYFHSSMTHFRLNKTVEYRGNPFDFYNTTFIFLFFNRLFNSDWIQCSSLW